MSILATNKKLIKVGQEYSAGSGISIDDYVISVTGDVGGKTYSAGDNIGIYTQDNQLYISGKDWEQDIANASANAYNAATAQIPTPFDPTYISAQIDNKLNSSDFSDWQNGQYSTDLQTIEGQINNKLDSSSFSDVSGNFLTAINIPESATWNETSNVVKESSANWDNTSDLVKESSASWNQGKTYEGISPIVVNNDENKVSADTWTFSAGSNVSFVDDNVNKITRIDCTVTGEGGDPQVNSFVYENSAKINDVNSSYQSNSGSFLTAAPADMATTGDVAELAQTISETYQVKGDYLVRSDSANFYPANNPSSFATEDWVTAQGYITGVDLSEYAKRTDVLSSIESATSGKLDVSSFASVSSDFLTTSFEIPQSANWEEATTAYEQNSATYLTAHQDLSDYQTTAGMVDYQTTANMTAYQPVGDYATTNELEQVSADITATIPSTAGLASESYVQTNSAVLTGMIDGKQDTLTFDYDEQDRISAINNSAIAAGDEFPVSADEAIQYVQTNSANIDETVTSYQTNSGTFLTAHQAISAEEWNGCYDNVSTNSGAWGGSALPISAGPGIKVNLIDNILVFSNDETVLWSGDLMAKDIEIVLSDSLKNYNSYKVYGYNTENKYGIVNEYTYNSAGPNWFSITDTRIQNNSYLTIYGSYVSANTDWDRLKITYMSNKYCISGGLTHSTTFGVGMTKIIGINRKQ